MTLIRRILFLVAGAALIPSSGVHGQVSNVEVGVLGGYSMPVRDIGKSTERGSRVQIRGRVQASPTVGAYVGVPLKQGAAKLRLQFMTALSGTTETEPTICSVVVGAACDPIEYDTGWWNGLALIEFGKERVGPRGIQLLVGVGVNGYSFTEPQCSPSLEDLLCRLSTDLLLDQVKPQLAFGVSFQQHLSFGGLSVEVLNQLAPYSTDDDAPSFAEGEIQNTLTIQGSLRFPRR